MQNPRREAGIITNTKRMARENKWRCRNTGKQDQAEKPSNIPAKKFGWNLQINSTEEGKASDSKSRGKEIAKEERSPPLDKLNKSNGSFRDLTVLCITKVNTEIKRYIRHRATTLLIECKRGVRTPGGVTTHSGTEHRIGRKDTAITSSVAVLVRVLSPIKNTTTASPA